MSEPRTRPKRSPWSFVPSLYFLQGLPYFLVDTTTTTFFVALGVTVESVGHWSSTLTLPWTLKPLWSPLVDLFSTKRAWTIVMQVVIAAAIAFLAFSATHSDAFVWCVVACAVIALASATHDVACDGWYLLALDERRQAQFVGVRSACYRLARVFVTGGIVYLAGSFQEARGAGRPLGLALDVRSSWAAAFACAGTVYAVGLAWGAYRMPRVEARPAERLSCGEKGREKGLFRLAVTSYFAKPRIGAIIAFILLYRVGESMLTKMSAPFLMKPGSEGGLAFSTKDVGLIAGTYGVIALIAGGMLGGFSIARFGLRRCLWPMVIGMHAPNALYAWAAFAQPGKAAVTAVITIEQFGYGLGFSAYMVVLMVVSRGSRFATTHYAISTGLMALAALVAGFISGDLVAMLGFGWFFVVVCVLAVPGMITLFFVPLETEVGAPSAS